MLITSLKLTDLIDTLQVLSRIKDVCRIFRVFLAILDNVGVGRLQQLVNRLYTFV